MFTTSLTFNIQAVTGQVFSNGVASKAGNFLLVKVSVNQKHLQSFRVDLELRNEKHCFDFIYLFIYLNIYIARIICVMIYDDRIYAST